MDEITLLEITNEYGQMLVHELDMKAKLARLETEILGVAQAQGRLNGRSTDRRKHQVNVALNGNDEYLLAQRNAREFEALRKGQEAYIGLLKAWLYSRSGIS